MKVLIINTTYEDNWTSRSMNGTDSAITFELYKKYSCNGHKCSLHITANHVWDKYTFIDEQKEYIGTFSSMDKVLEKNPFLGNVLIVTHEQWLDKVNPEWRTNPRYKYW
jgi:hypothetical protein